VKFFFQGNINGETVALALVSIYSPPDTDLLAESYGTLYTCKYQGDNCLEVILAKDILSVVAMVPLPSDPESPEDIEEGSQYFLVEKPGLEIFILGGATESQDDEDEGNFITAE
jgi:hypothetical protein